MEPSPPFSETAGFAGFASWWFSECATCLTVGVHATSLQMWMEFAFWMQAGLRHDPIPQLEQYCPAIGTWFYNKTTTHTPLYTIALSLTVLKFSRRLKMIWYLLLWGEDCGKRCSEWVGWLNRKNASDAEFRHFQPSLFQGWDFSRQTNLVPTNCWNIWKGNKYWVAFIFCHVVHC